MPDVAATVQDYRRAFGYLIAEGIDAWMSQGGRSRGEVRDKGDYHFWLTSDGNQDLNFFNNNDTVGFNAGEPAYPSHTRRTSSSPSERMGILRGGELYIRIRSGTLNKTAEVGPVASPQFIDQILELAKVWRRKDLSGKGNTDSESLVTSQKSTETNAIIKIRKGQHRFRVKALNNFNSTCALSGCQSEFILDACHISGWASDTSSRLDHCNAILLRTDLHLLYDLKKLHFVLKAGRLVARFAPDVRDHYANLNGTLITFPCLSPEEIKRWRARLVGK